MKVSALDRAIAALREQRKPIEQQLAAINLAIVALQEQKDQKAARTPLKMPRKAKKAAAPTVDTP